MDWLNMPLELFAGIAVYLSPREVVKLERVCKSWQDNLNSSLIWQTMAVATHPALLKCQTIIDWREYALKNLIVIQNMKLNRCVVRALRSSDASGYSQIFHRCHVVGDEVLITTVENAAATSYSSTTVKDHRIVNVNTGEETVLDVKSSNVLLMKNYIVYTNGTANYDNLEVANKISIVDRSTNAKPIIMDRIGNRFKFTNGTKGQMNDNTDYNTFVICHTGTNSFYVVDVEQRSWKEFNYDPLVPGMNLVNRYRLNGKYLAYSQLGERYADTNKRFLHLVIVDTETGETVFTEKTDEFTEWDFAEDRVIFGANYADGVKWILTSFDGTILQQYNSDKPSENLYMISLLKICGGFIVYLKHSQFYFFDAISGEMLCCVNTNVAVAAEVGQIYLIGTGKFLYWNRKMTKIFDFESNSLTRQVKVKILYTADEIKKLGLEPVVTCQVPFYDLMKFSMQKINETNLDRVASVLISYNKEHNERVSMIYCAIESEGGIAGNVAASKLITTITSYPIRINMTPHEFVGESLVERPPGHIHYNRGVKKHVCGPAVVYKEKLINGEWVPSD